MTSEFTLEPTEKFFKENSYFDLDPSNVVMFEQRMIPAVDFDGKIILEKKNKIAMAPGLRHFLKTMHNQLDLLLFSTFRTELYYDSL